MFVHLQDALNALVLGGQWLIALADSRTDLGYIRNGRHVHDQFYRGLVISPWVILLSLTDLKPGRDEFAHTDSFFILDFRRWSFENGQICWCA